MAPLWVLKHSTPTSASGSCQVWQTWIKVRLALPIIDSCGPLLFYLVHFTSDLSFSSSQTQQPFGVLKPSTPTSASGSCQVWRPCGAVRLSLPILDSCGRLFFYLVDFTSYLSSSSSQTQKPFLMLPCSTPTSAAGTCQVWQTWQTVSLAFPIVDI